MSNHSYRVPMGDLAYRDEAVRFSIWVLGIKFRCEENIQICSRIVSNVLNGQLKEALTLVGQLPGHRIQRKMEAYIRILQNMTFESIQVDEEVLEFARWFMCIVLEEDQSDIRNDIITLLFYNHSIWADLRVSDLDCPMTRDRVGDYLHIMQSL